MIVNNSVKGIKRTSIGFEDYLLVFMLIAVSGNPLFTGEWYQIAAAIIAAVFALSRKRLSLGKEIMPWLLIFFILFTFQRLILPSVSIAADIKFFAMLLAGYFVTSILGINFRNAYLRVMVFIAAVSLILWPINLFYLFPGIEVDRYISVIFYNYINRDFDTIRRNCAMFGEPGLYQGFLLLTPLLYIGQIKQLWAEHKNECIILILALLSSMSTTGYVVFAVLIFLVFNKKVKNIFLKIFLVVSLLIVASWAYSTFDFLGSKIEDQFGSAQEYRKGEVTWTRFGSAQVDFDNIEKHPIIGNGFLMLEKYGALAEYMGGAGNGFTGAVNTFGIPLMVMYLLALFRRAPSPSKYDKFVFVLIVVLMLNGEQFLNFPLFWSLLFVKYPVNCL